VNASGVPLRDGDRVVGDERALPPGEQHLRDAGGREHADVPGAAVGDVGEHLEAEPGQAGLDRRVAPDELGARGRDAERRGSADVLAREVDRAEIEVGDERDQVRGGGRAVVRLRRGSGVAEAAEVDGDDAVMLAQERDELAEGPRALREPVDQEHR
jgi:hypothetical protein